MKAKTSRSYGGVTQEARIEARREKLMEAAERLLERHGPAGASVTAICAEAGLTPRYFYESFANREVLLHAVFDRVCGYMLRDIATAGDDANPVSAVIGRFLSILRDHPHLSRMFLVDFDAQDSEMRKTGHALAAAIVGMIAPEVASPLVRAGIAGAIFRTARAWIEGGTAQPIADVTAIIRRFVEAGR